MSYVVALPEVMSAAATDVASIGSVVATASQGVAGATTTVLAAAEDEVSAAIAALFSAHGQDYQALSAQLAVFHERFVQALTGAAKGYAAAELANASLLQSEFASGIGNGFATIHQEIQRAPTALAAGFTQVPPFAAAQAGIFTGTPSGAAGFDIASLWPVKPPAEFVCARNSLCNPKQSTFSAHCQRHTAAVVVSWQLPTAVAELAAGTDGPVHHL